MSHQGKHRGGCRPRRAVEIGSCGRPSPILIAAKDAVREVSQQLQIRGSGVCRKAAVAYDFHSDALGYFLAPILEHLKIRMAMRIDEARRDGQPITLDHARIGRGCERTSLNNRLSGNEEIAAPWGHPGPIDDCAAAKPDSRHDVSTSAFSDVPHI